MFERRKGAPFLSSLYLIRWNQRDNGRHFNGSIPQDVKRLKALTDLISRTISAALYTRCIPGRALLHSHRVGKPQGHPARMSPHSSHTGIRVSISIPVRRCVGSAGVVLYTAAHPRVGELLDAWYRSPLDSTCAPRPRGDGGRGRRAVRWLAPSRSIPLAFWFMQKVTPPIYTPPLFQELF